MIVSFLLVGREQMPLAERMVASVRRTMGNVHILQHTDHDTPAVEGVNEVSRVTYRGGRLMTYRLMHLASVWADQLVLDTDTIVQKDPMADTELRGDWDVALTKRAGPILDKSGTDVAKLYPYNTGVMFSRNRDFWADCLKVCMKLPEEMQKWYGDQASVRAVADSKRYAVKELDCNKWNYTPRAADEKSDAVVLHYKGLRKEWMLAKWPGKTTPR